MSLHADFRKLKFSQIAELDLPVPDDLTDPDDRQDWRSYMEALPPAKALEKFGSALDEFHFGWQLANLNNIPVTDAEKIRIYSKWEAASIASGPVYKSLGYKSGGEPAAIDSDITYIISFVTDFLKAVGSNHLIKWQDRAKAHGAIDAEEKFSRFLIDAHKNYVSQQSRKGRNGPASSGPA